MTDSSSNGEGSQSTIQLNIKTLESQMHSFHVDKQSTVSTLKEKIEQELNIPAMEQRLIFRGRVLKDEHSLSEYQVENGHTLHLVTRQSSPDGNNDDPNANNRTHGVEAGGTAASNSRIGQISHSVLLGAINVGDIGDGVVPDASRVIGAVLNSLGLGAAVQPANAAQQNEGGASRSVGGHQRSGQGAQAQPQVIQIPLNAAAASPLPSLSAPIPDSLTTIREFVARMEQAQIGNQQPGTSTNSETSRADLPAARGAPNAETLAAVLRQAERLLGGHVTSALSHVAGRLEREGGSSDVLLRSQIQTESMQLGLIMQHLGALCLELGRTILLLRMGQSPSQATVNAGPAIYINSAGPNPIMVQPFPWQTSPLFGGAFSSSNPAPVAVGNVPRHINIHIHAGTAVAPVISSSNARTSSADSLSADTGGSLSAPMLHMRNLQTPASDVSNAAQTSSSSGSADFSVPLIAGINSRARSLPGNVQAGNQPALNSLQLGPGAGVSVTNVTVAEINSAIARARANQRGLFPEIPPESVSISASSTANAENGETIGNQPALNSLQLGPGAGVSVTDVSVADINSAIARAIANQRGLFPQIPPESVSVSASSTANAENGETLVSAASTANSGAEESRDSPLPDKKENDNQPEEPQNEPKPSPLGLGLGLGNLERKKRSKPAKAASDSVATGQQVLRSLAESSSSDQAPKSSAPMDEQGADNDVMDPDVLAEAMESPAFDGFLAGISDQIGVGSPNLLRSMMQQLTRNPAIMSTVGRVAQQADSQGLGALLSGAGGGQQGGLDLSTLFQQMMPIVSQVVGSAANQTQTSARSDLRNESLLQEAVQSIQRVDAPEDVFISVARAAAIPEEMASALSSDDDLVAAYVEMLRRDLDARLSATSSDQSLS